MFNSVKELIDLLHSLNLTISTAESCTGGLVASSIVDVSGSSAVFNEGYITYSNEAKERILGVKQETLLQFGAVSAETAREMAEGVRRISGSDVSMSTTGIAGPTGGTKEKPVGLVYICVSYQSICHVKELRLNGDRTSNRVNTVEEVMQLVLDVLMTFCN